MKLAICLHGLVGNIEGKSGDSNVGAKEVLELSYLHWKRFFIEPYKPDIFIHSWNLNLENEIQKLFEPKLIKVEKQITFNIPDWIPGDNRRKNNHYSKWYSNKEATNLMLKYNKLHDVGYDFVMNARFDIAWQKNFDLNILNNNKFYLGGWFRHSKNKVKDFWFLSSPKNMKKFSQIYNEIENLCKDPKSISKSNGISNHKLAAKHLLNLGFNVETLLMCDDNFDGSKSDYPLVRYFYYGAKQ